jgi:hypothetical protein
MNRAYLKPRLLFVGGVMAVTLIFAWVVQNPTQYFDKVLTICGTVAALYVMAAIALRWI